jgi:uncharacterized protein (TIGR02246 family)
VRCFDVVKSNEKYYSNNCTLLASFAFGQAERSESAPNRERDEKAIEDVLRDFADAWNRHDAKAFSMVFAEDAAFTNVVGMSAHGRAEIEKFHAPLFATRFRDTHQTIADVKIRFITPDVAAVDARWEMTGRERPRRSGHPCEKGATESRYDKIQWPVANHSHA